MNIFVTGIIIIVIVLLILKFLANLNTKKLSKFVRFIIFSLSLILALIFALGGRFLFSLPLILVGLGIIKLKGLTLIQIFQLWRLINFMRSSGRFSQGTFNQPQSSSSLSLEEAYKILNVKKNATKKEVNKAAQKLQKKLHPDVSPETARLSALVNEARDLILKNIS